MKKTTIAVVSDTHISKNWDKVAKFVRGKAKFLNPNQELRNVVKDINSDNHISSIVFNGDAVDYVYADYRRFTDFLKNLGKKRPTNWDIFYDLIKDLKKPHFQIPGNHDYRLEPYNYMYYYRLVHMNLPDRIRKKVANKIGHHSQRWLFEFKTIMISNKFDYPLQYKGKKCPYFERVNNFNCIFLNTRPDGFSRLRNLGKYFWKVIRSRHFDMSAEGLKKEDVSFTKKNLEKKGKKFNIFMHTPLINCTWSKVGKKYHLSTDNFLSNLIKNKLGHEVCLEGGGKLLNVLRKSDKNIMVVSSHIHDAKYFLIDKKSLIATEVSLNDFNSKINDSTFIKHFTTLAMGGFSHYNRTKKTGYAKITDEGVEEIVLHEFDPNRENKHSFDWNFFAFIKELILPR